MTIATEIATITDYNSTDISNAVTEATSFCSLHETDHDEVIKSAAIWLLERQRLERKASSDPTLVIPKIKELHELIDSLITAEEDEDIIVHEYLSPKANNKNMWYDPQ